MKRDGLKVLRVHTMRQKEPFFGLNVHDEGLGQSPRSLSSGVQSGHSLFLG
jgi:hypothetical protein